MRLLEEGLFQQESGVAKISPCRWRFVSNTTFLSHFTPLSPIPPITLPSYTLLFLTLYKLYYIFTFILTGTII